MTICWRKNRLRKGLRPKYIVRKCKTVSIEWGLVLGHQGSMVRSFSSVIFPQESDSLWSMPVSHIEPHHMSVAQLVLSEKLSGILLCFLYFSVRIYMHIFLYFSITDKILWPKQLTEECFLGLQLQRNRGHHGREAWQQVTGVEAEAGSWNWSHLQSQLSPMEELQIAPKELKGFAAP